MAHCLNTQPFAAMRTVFHQSYFTNATGRQLYALATHLDEFPEEWPPDDEGSSGLGAAKAAKTAGYIERYEHTFSFAEFQAALQTQPLIVGTYWTDSMFYPDSRGIVTPGPLTTQNIAGGHEYCALGIDYENKLLKFRNSWGKSWGLSGNFYVSFQDFATLLAADGDSTVPKANF
jgi:hypothetical protein